MALNFRLTPAAAAASLWLTSAVLVACGGGAASAPPGTTVAPADVSTSGWVVDGYLNGATVLCDSNGNGVIDAGEVTVSSLASGLFTFTQGCSAALVAQGGTSVDTGLPFKGVLKAPAGAKVLTPLTTLLVAGLTQDQIISTLALPAGTVLASTDPALKAGNGTLANADLMKKSLLVQQLLQKATELFAGLAGAAGDAVVQAIYTESALAFADTLKTGSTLVAAGASTGTVSSALAASLVKAAALRVGSAAAVSSGVKTALAAVNADALGQVAAGALKAQGELILAASNADLATVSKAAQSDDKITSFIVANKAQLAAAPGAGSTSLASALTDLVNGVAPPTPPAAPTNYLALAADSISLVNGAASTPYTMAQFQSDAGISVAWPIAAPMMLRLSLNEVGSYTLPTDQKLTAAVSITETAAGGQGTILAYIDNVAVTKTPAGLAVVVGTGAAATVYGVSADGKKKAVIDFSASVAGVQNTLVSTAGSSNNIVLGSVIQYAINKVSNDFTGIHALRGKYKVQIVVTDLPLRKADGSQLPGLTITVPTALDSTGAVSASKPVSGWGLIGNISLTD